MVRFMRMTTPYQHSNGTWYLRKRVPADLQSFTSKKEIKRSLKTKDAKEARLRYPEVLLEINRELGLIRLNAQPEQALSSREITAICELWLKEKLIQIENDEWQLANWFTQSIGIKSEDTPTEVTAYDYWGDLVEHPNQNYEERKKLTDPDIKRLIIKHDLKIHEDSTTYKRFNLELLKHYIKLQKAAERRLAQDHTFTPETPLGDNLSSTLASTKIGSTLRFSAVVEKWKTYTRHQNPQNAEQLFADYHASFERFIAFKGDVPVDEIHKKDIAEFRDQLFRLPTHPPKAVKALSFAEQISYAETGNKQTLSSNTVRNAIIHIRAVFSFAVNSGYMKENVAAGVEPKRQRKARVVENLNYYTQSDLDAIFALPVFTEGYRPARADYGEAPFWVPLIMYYTGARIEEVCQLHKANIKRDEKSGIYLFRFDESVEGARVKESASARDVPIADALLSHGLLKYIEGLPDVSPLFPKLTRSSKGKISHAFGKWWGNYIRTETGNDFAGRKPAHAFRHTFETNARILNIRQDVSNAITGRTSGHSGEGYGGYITSAKQAVDSIPPLVIEGSP